MSERERDAPIKDLHMTQTEAELKAGELNAAVMTQAIRTNTGMRVQYEAVCEEGSWEVKPHWRAPVVRLPLPGTERHRSVLSELPPS